MKSPQDDPETKHSSTIPPPLTPRKLLDSLLKDDGAMPTARLGIRSIAFVLDAILLFAITSVIIWKVILPQEHPDALVQTQEWQLELIEWFYAGGYSDAKTMPQPSTDLTAALTMASEVNFLLFWIYFAVGEAFFAGGSLGKRACRIKTVSTVTLGAPTVFSGITRGGLKTIMLLFFPPFSVFFTLAFILFNKRRQMGHDVLSRTAVVDERYINQEIT